ncbi:succinate--CoA ligase subunit alpha [candidate division KSB1 bacterium]|nr:succinate--CoA ligase subunit alpha [candidate division KSB1 bacterium]NIR71848.1 succinate--CoA ligase subunit alpha [candidate division KSB1 bacterium]NIS25364.1 succinate--CoA ligase subunit alpha [candidate division KSB1 bacterium]NIT71834.1 succinate--CoA ligase subunit alpha [candidate division KSB1 bacterium]NIU25572.1 succinate--CoA ligase subunit alpha [candidate division KSB1 bacterium]
MSILVDEKTRVVVQGITGGEGSFHTRQMMEAGTNVIAGVVPGKGGQRFDDQVPVFNSVNEAVEKEGADASVVFVPPPFAADAIMEAADAGVAVVVCITEGIPTKDMVSVFSYLKDRDTRLIGPNCPGVISPEKCKIGIMPAFIHTPGAVGVVSRSGTLTYEAVKQLSDLGIGQSTCIGIGGDPIIGTSFTDALRLFKKDPDTKGVVIIGEIGGTAEQEAAAYIRSEFDKPVVAFIAGRTAPPGRRMGHAGAIISGSGGTAQEKIEILKDAGVHVANNPAEIASTMQNAL